MSEGHSTIRYRILEDHSGCRVGSDGSFWRLKDSKWIRVSGWADNDGDRKVCIPLGVRNRKKTVKVAVLVLNYFVGPKPPGMECCHKDDDKDNNDLSNLYWGTHAQNMMDRELNGKVYHPRGEEHHAAVLTVEDVKEIRRRWREENPRPTKTSMAREYRVSETAIYAIVTRRTWRFLD